MESVQTFGRKKTAVAVAYCKKGRGLIKINGCPIELVEPEMLRYKVFEPILLLGRERFANVDIRLRVKGGGYTSQIYAIRQVRPRLGLGLSDLARTSSDASYGSCSHVGSRRGPLGFARCTTPNTHSHPRCCPRLGRTTQSLATRSPSTLIRRRTGSPILPPPPVSVAVVAPSSKGKDPPAAARCTPHTLPWLGRNARQTLVARPLCPEP